METKDILCKLTGEQMLKTRKLYEEVFIEDAPEFTNYYYSYKAPGNTAFVIMNEADGEILSMLHLSPYQMCLRGAEGWIRFSAFYIVAVATKEAFRHRGYMRRLILEAFEYCKQEDVPFVFLMPADSAIYEPFGFQYIYERPEFYFNQGLLPAGMRRKAFCPEDAKKLAEFSNRQLKKQYHFYILRSEEYYRVLEKELNAQNGSIQIFWKDQEIMGYYLITDEQIPDPAYGKDQIREAVLSEEMLVLCKQENLCPPIQTSKVRHPVIMGRQIRKDWPDCARLFSGQGGFLNELI